MNISESWLAGETTCYRKLVEYTQYKDGYNAFRGYLPALRDSWMFTSGGMQTGPIERYYGTAGAWCTMCFKARVEGMFENRDSAIAFAGKVLGFLKETNNLHQTGNVMWLRMTDFPDEPIETPIQNESGDIAAIVWRIIIPLEMVIATEAEYPAS